MFLFPTDIFFLLSNEYFLTVKMASNSDALSQKKLNKFRFLFRFQRYKIIYFRKKLSYAGGGGVMKL